MEDITIYQILFWLGWLFVIGGVFWSVYQLSKRLFSKEPANKRRQIKRGIFVLIGSPVLIFAIWACSIFGFLAFLIGHDYVGTTYAKLFLAGDCYPIVYPSGEELVPEDSQTIEYEASDSPEEVAAFFKDAFAITIWKSDSLWEITSDETESQNKYTLSCFSNLGGGFKEQSCIFIETEHDGSLIETTWSILPSDFPGGCFR